MLTIVLTPETEHRLSERARERGVSETELARELLEDVLDAAEIDDPAVLAAADEGLADIAAGRFTVLDGPADFDRLGAELAARLRQRGGGLFEA